MDRIAAAVAGERGLAGKGLEQARKNPSGEVTEEGRSEVKVG